MKSSSVRCLAVLLVIVVWSMASCTRGDDEKVSIYSPRFKSIDDSITQEETKQTVVSEKDFRTIIVQVAQKNIPAVVHIEVTQSQEVANPFSPFESDPFFRHFFNFPQGPRQ
ncbi:MAG TPA: hypothetical protein PLU54_06095, partial [Deltaproteobacteria bacterium]|nr:hypothetical protein [Deltaproteobacteria bacterium]